MTTEDDQPGQVEALLDTPDLANALESEQFRRFLDQIPVAIAVSTLSGPERVIYANPEFEVVCGIGADTLEGKSWEQLPGQSVGPDDASHRSLAEAVTVEADALGIFCIQRRDEGEIKVEAFSNVIEDEDSKPVFRLVALVEIGTHAQHEHDALQERVRQKDTLLRELQHRVRNNLQMITALIRMEERNNPNKGGDRPFDRLAGRVEALQMLYDNLTEETLDAEIDLGTYLGQIATAVMRANAVEGIRLDMKVDSYRVSVNVAMPTGLVVNELMTNALKHAFTHGNGGTITLHCLSDGEGSRVMLADDGVGMPSGMIWPQRGKLAALIVRSLEENAHARLEVKSDGKGTRVTIAFKRSEVVSAD
jgi:two-component sensor histidine kinase